MRPIDGDALIAQMEADAEQMEAPIAKLFAYAAIYDVENAPTIEARKKGRWIGACCSNCRVSRYNWQSEPFGTWNFCPNCGADMREEGGV